MQLKKNRIYFICLLAMLTFFAESALATAPIPGINIVVKRNPGGIVINTRQTDDGGKMSLRLEGGEYDLSISYDQMMAVIARIDKNKVSNNGCYRIQLTLNPDSAGITANGGTLPRIIEITKNTGTIPLVVPAKGGTIRFTLTYEGCRWGEKK